MAKRQRVVAYRSAVLSRVFWLQLPLPLPEGGSK